MKDIALFIISITLLILVKSYLKNNIPKSFVKRYLNGNEKFSVVIIDHGSRVKEANEALHKLCDKYALKSNLDVEPAHMELAEPSIRSACEKCILKGSKTIICYPYFLSKGRHVTEDIPKLIEEVQRDHPTITITLCEPLGSKVDSILSIIDNTVQSSLDTTFQ